ncbi:MAG: hypothetical protein ABSE98_04735 [Acidimicrobiales bacterium]
MTRLANDDALRETALGEGGIHTAVGDRTWVDDSTVSPSLSAELSKLAVNLLLLSGVATLAEALTAGRRRATSRTTS